MTPFALNRRRAEQGLRAPTPVVRPAMDALQWKEDADRWRRTAQELSTQNDTLSRNLAAALAETGSKARRIAELERIVSELMDEESDPPLDLTTPASPPKRRGRGRPRKHA